MSLKPWAQGMRSLGPGLYIDAEGSIHMDPEEICEALNKPPTPANQRMATAGALDAIRATWPGIRIEETET